MKLAQFASARERQRETEREREREKERERERHAIPSHWEIGCSKTTNN